MFLSETWRIFSLGQDVLSLLRILGFTEPLARVMLLTRRFDGQGQVAD
jgi:hypothetical protein